MAMRRVRVDRAARHGPPFLDDIFRCATEQIQALEGLAVQTIAQRTPAHNEALAKLWTILSQLPINGVASCVGITKAVLLLTDGRIGPAFDSQVRQRLRVGKPETCGAWLAVLEEIGEDIAAFEDRCGPLANAVPARFAAIPYGRLYDMALGPR
jgi:hypothetical protein